MQKGCPRKEKRSPELIDQGARGKEQVTKEKGGTIPAPDGAFYKQERHADKLQRTAGTPDTFKSTVFLSAFFSFVY